MNKTAMAKVAEYSREKKEKTELSIEDIVNILNKTKSFESDLNKIENKANNVIKTFNQFSNELNEIKNSYLSNKKDYEMIGNALNKHFKDLRAKAKEIGVNINEIPAYENYSLAVKNIRSAFDLNQKIWNMVYKYSM